MADAVGHTRSSYFTAFQWWPTGKTVFFVKSLARRCVVWCDRLCKCNTLRAATTTVVLGHALSILSQSSAVFGGYIFLVVLVVFFFFLGRVPTTSGRTRGYSNSQALANKDDIYSFVTTPPRLLQEDCVNVCFILCPPCPLSKLCSGSHRHRLIDR